MKVHILIVACIAVLIVVAQPLSAQTAAKRVNHLKFEAFHPGSQIFVSKQLQEDNSTLFVLTSRHRFALIWQTEFEKSSGGYEIRVSSPHVSGVHYIAFTEKEMTEINPFTVKAEIHRPN